MPLLVKRLSFLDRFLTAWIFIAMIMVVFSGCLFPVIAAFLDKYSYDTTSIPIVI